MLIECLIKREGPTVVSRSGPSYSFEPRPELTDGDTKTPVCNVPDEKMQKQLLESGLYRKYEPKGSKKAAPEGANTLTKEAFFQLVNYAQVKKAIKTCDDIALLDEIGAHESAQENKREWVIEELKARLNELETK